MYHHQNKNERWGVTPQYIDTRLSTHMVCGYGFDSSFWEKRIVFLSWPFKIVQTLQSARFVIDVRIFD